jgi:transposase
LFQTEPGIGPIGAARFSAYIQTPHRFSNRRKLWRYCRLGVSFRSSDGKPLSHPKLDRSGCGRLKDVARKAFDAAMRRQESNSFQRAYEQALLSTPERGARAIKRDAEDRFGLKGDVADAFTLPGRVGLNSAL